MGHAAGVTPGIFLPGYGARAASYARGLPAGWTAVQPPSFRISDGRFPALARWVVDLVERSDGPVLLAGHSMGGALAIHAAARRPHRVAGLVLFAPAGLPLLHPSRTTGREVVRNAIRGRYTIPDVLDATIDGLSAPRAARRLAHELERLDLRSSIEAVARAGVPATGVASATDRLVTLGHCRAVASLLGAELRVVDDPGGHTWMYGAWDRFAVELERARGGRPPAPRHPSSSSAVRRVAT